MRKSRVIAAATALVVAGLGLTACSSGGGGSAESGELRLGIDEPKSLIPANTTESEGAAVLERLYVGLYTYNPDGSLKPVIAESEPQSKDSKTWTIKIQEGWEFQNGEKITADTFVKSWNFAAYGANANTGAGFFSKIAGFEDVQGEKPKSKEMSGLKAKDDTTLEVTLTNEFVGFPVTLGYQVFAPVADACLEDIKACNDKPIGNGPYEMDGKWKHKESITVKQWKAYKGEKPNIKKTFFKIYTGDSTAYPDFEAGKIDISGIPSEKYEEAKQEYGDDIIQEKTANTWGMAFPSNDKNYKDPDVRKAFSMAIDRDAYIKGTFQGRYETANSWTPPIIPGYKADTCGDTCVFNKKEAKKLLDSTDFPQDEKVVLWTTPGPGEDYTKKLGDMIKDNLGLEYELKSLEWADFLQKRTDHGITGPYLSGWVPDYPLNEDYLAPLYGNGPENNFGYYNKDFEAALQAGDTAKDLDAAELKYQEAEEMLADDPPLAPIWIESTATLLGDRVDTKTYKRNPILGGFDIYKLKLTE